MTTVPLIGGCASDTPDDGDNGTPVEPVEPDGDNGEEPDGEEPTEPDADDGSSEQPDATAPDTLTVTVYWVSAGENALGVQREIPYTKAVATATMKLLLAGPTDAEKATWPAISTAVPAGSELLGITVADGVATVDLSREFESGAGTFSVTARLAQVVYTLTQFPTVDAVEFYIEGERSEVFSSEGVVLDGPQTLEDFAHLLPIDA
jgi:germination protein M